MKKNIIAILFAILVVVGLVNCGGDDEPVKIPDVTGLTLSEAVEKLNDAGFYNQKHQYPNDIKIPDGTVTRQSPKAGSEQPTYTKITLTVKSDWQIQQEKLEKEMQADRRKAEKETKKREKEKAERQAEADRITRIANGLKGKNAVEAMNILEKDNLLGDIAYSTGATEDNLEQHIRDNDADGIQWVVTDATPRMADDGGHVDLKVNTKAIVDAANAQKEQADKLSQKLSQGAASVACKEYGRQQYPAGFDMHLFNETFTPVDDNTWNVTATVDITNMFGTELKDRTCTCKVTGTTDNPQVVEFNVY